MSLLSPAFGEYGPLPARYTADGEELSPPLRWTNPPPETRTLAVACDDPDAPSGVVAHWVAWNIGPDQRHLREGISETSALGSMREGINDLGTRGYAGPNPPRGERHRYAFRVFALDVRIDLPAYATRAQLDEAMAGHVLAEGVLFARYEHA